MAISRYHTAVFTILGYANGSTPDARGNIHITQLSGTHLSGDLRYSKLGAGSIGVIAEKRGVLGYGVNCVTEGTNSCVMHAAQLQAGADHLYSQ